MDNKKIIKIYFPVNIKNFLKKYWPISLFKLFTLMDIILFAC